MPLFAEIFGPQKGASKQTVHEMDAKAQAIVNHVKAAYEIDLMSDGAGAAGGLGGAILLLGGTIVPGFATIAQLIELEKQLADTDLILTGEGRMDYQTANGKVPYGVAQLAQKRGIPVVGLCGSRMEDIGALQDLLLGVFSIQQAPLSLEEALQKEVALNNMRTTAREVGQLVAYQRSASCGWS